jgi:regulator of cell morphogenesis and NO signaling
MTSSSQFTATGRAPNGPAVPVRLGWDARPLTELTAHIIESFHDTLSVELPRLVAMARRVEERHGADQPNAAAIATALQRFAKNVRAHIAQEESETFPLIDRLETRSAAPSGPARFLAAEGGSRSAQADALGILASLRTLTNIYAPPAGACETTLGLYQGLEELEALMKLYVHLESNVLFPRAEALALAARQGASHDHECSPNHARSEHRRNRAERRHPDGGSRR